MVLLPWRKYGHSTPWLLMALLVMLFRPHAVAGWSVLVLGGSGFRGHMTTEILLRSGHQVTVLSRGRPYWAILDKLGKLGMTLWKCNRTIVYDGVAGLQPNTSGLAVCSNLTSSTNKFDAVVDFSSKNAEDLKQVLRLLHNRVGFYIFMSNHGVYSVSINATHDGPLLESDAVRPGREVSPLDRFELKGQNPRGNDFMECEEELMRQYNAGGVPFTVFRLANVFGPKENTLRYWLLHLWIRAHVALHLPMHLDELLLETPISMTYSPDIAQAVARVLAKGLGEACCSEHVEAQVFNLACEEAPNQRNLYNYIAEPQGLNYVETTEMPRNKSIILYPEIVRGPLNTAKALEVLRWTPTDLQKAARSVARFYDRVMLDESKHRWERDVMYSKLKRMLGEDGPNFVSWTRAHYAERRKKELYDELDDEDEDDIVLFRPSPEKRGRRKRRKGAKSSPEL